MYTKKREDEKAMAVYNDMKTSGEPIAIEVHNQILRLFSMKGMYEEAEKLFFELDVPPTLVTYNTMMKMYGIWSSKIVMNEHESKRIITKCRVMVDKLLQSNMPLDLIICNCILNVYCRYYGTRGDTGTILEFYKEMNEREIKPDIITFNTLIHMFASCNLESGIKSCMEAMSIHNIKPDCTTYSSILECTLGQKRGSWEWTGAESSTVMSSTNDNNYYKNYNNNDNNNDNDNYINNYKNYDDEDDEDDENVKEGEKKMEVIGATEKTFASMVKLLASNFEMGYLTNVIEEMKEKRLLNKKTLSIVLSMNEKSDVLNEEGVESLTWLGFEME